MMRIFSPALPILFAVFTVLFVLLLRWLTARRMRIEIAPIKSISRPVSVILIVPVTGFNRSLHDNLSSLLNQEYPYEHLICVTDTEDDPAVPIIQQLQTADQRVSHICAGLAVHCSQKNYNLIAGYRYIEPFDGIIVFCDSGHFAPACWLGRLIQPLVDSSTAIVSSGYHHLLPTSTSIGSIGQIICVLALNLVRRIPIAAQPWGGATAIRANDFRALDIINLWSETIVDDVVLAAHLQKNKKKVVIPAAADLTTYITSPTFRSWQIWLTRQWAYLKFVFPGSWAILGTAGIFLTIILSCSTLILLTAWTNVYPTELVFISAGYVFFFILFSMLLRTQHPNPGPFYLWYPALHLAMFMAGWCHITTWFTSTIYWAGITYSIGKKGKVTHLRRDTNTRRKE